MVSRPCTEHLCCVHILDCATPVGMISGNVQCNLIVCVCLCLCLCVSVSFCHMCVCVCVCVCVHARVCPMCVCMHACHRCLQAVVIIDMLLAFFETPTSIR